MKLSRPAILLASAVSYAAAGKPKISISVRDGKFDGLDALDPTVSWESSDLRIGNVLDVSCGVRASAQPTRDVSSLPQMVWSRARAHVAGWGVSARADVNAQDLGRTSIQVDADNRDVDLSLRVTASAGKAFNVRAVQATKSFDLYGAHFAITPRLDLEKDDRNVEVSYSGDGTDVRLTASTSSGHAITISRQVDPDNRVAPTLTSSGNIALEWERRLSDDSSLTATLRPNDSLNVEWRDSRAWTANVNMPMEGASITGANVSIKRDVTFL